MLEEPNPDASLAPEPAEPAPSTELVVPARRAVIRQPRRWPEMAVRARAQLMRLRENPAAMVAVSAAATVGSAALTAGLRRLLRDEPGSRTAVVAVGGYVVHEVHVVHHVVHHVIGPVTTPEHRGGGS